MDDSTNQLAGILVVLTMALVTYTVFVPIFTQDSKHLRRGLFLLGLLAVFAFVLHLAKMI